MPNSPNPKVESFRDLLVWKRGIELVIDTYRLTEQFPKRETYGLVSQMRQAAVSIPANIAEGHARPTTKDFLRFLGIAMGSLRELETYLEVSQRLQYAETHQLVPTSRLASEIGAMLTRLRSRLRGRVVP